MELRGGARFWELLGVAGGNCWELGIAGSTSKRHSQIRASKQTYKDALRRIGIKISPAFFTACGLRYLNELNLFSNPAPGPFS